MVERQILKNGLTLLFEPVPGVRSASVGVWLRLGSRNESARHSGICHFIEHLVFKGTGSRTAREISLLSDRIGGNLDAFTTKETTCFYARVLDEHLPLAIDLLTDIVRDPRFDAADIASEKNVILEEIRMVHDSPEDRVYDLFCETFWPRHPLGRPIQGTERTVGAMGRRTIMGWFRRAYVPGNMVVVVAGKVGAAARRRLRAAFESLPPGTTASPGGPPRFRPGVVTESRPQLGQVHLLLGVAGLPSGDDDRFTLHLLNTILGGSLSSRLFLKVREERGLVYSIGTQVHAYRGGGLVLVYAGTSPGNVREVLTLTVDELRRIAAEAPGEEELAVARDHLKGNMLLALESTSSRMSRAAREEMILGRHVPADEIIARLEAVRPEDVRALAERLFGRQRTGLAAVGRTGRLRLRELELSA